MMAIPEPCQKEEKEDRRGKKKEELLAIVKEEEGTDGRRVIPRARRGKNFLSSSFRPLPPSRRRGKKERIGKGSSSSFSSFSPHKNKQPKAKLQTSPSYD